MSDMHHLSVIDGAFLHMESAEMPMHVGSLALFEPPAGEPGDTGTWFDAVKAHVASRMHLAPVFTRKLALMPFDLANPVWIADDDIDLDYHIRTTVLPKPGTMAQLEALAARLHSSLLDRSRPLWEFYVIEGLADGRIGFYSKVHHAAVDGQAAVAMGNSVFDLTVEPRRVKPPRATRGHRYQLGVAELLSAAFRNQMQQLLQFARLMPPLATAAYGAAKKALADRGKKNTGAGLLASLKQAPATPFNSSITNQRAFAGVALPLPEVKAIGKAHGASINDMVLWLCSTAMRDYLRESRELPDKSLVAGVPISLRSEGDTRSNNQVSGTVIDLATHIADPAKRLAAIMVATQAMKTQMGTFGDLIPKDFPSLGSPWLLSNVPGPQVPLYLAGAKMVGNYPLSIVVHGVALNITVQSYMGQLCFGLIACRRAVPDVKELAAHLQQALVALRAMPLPLPAVSVAPETAAAAAQVTSNVVAAKKVARPVAAKPARRAAAPPAVRPHARKPNLKVVPVAPTKTRIKRAAA
jgi:diacylglycerol O-acyltransferase / wax synthase